MSVPGISLPVSRGLSFSGMCNPLSVRCLWYRRALCRPHRTINAPFCGSFGVPGMSAAGRHANGAASACRYGGRGPGICKKQGCVFVPQKLSFGGFYDHPNNLALRRCPVRRTPCGRLPNHPPLPSVTGDSGLAASGMPPTCSTRFTRSHGGGRANVNTLLSLRRKSGYPSILRFGRHVCREA